MRKALIIAALLAVIQLSGNPLRGQAASVGKEAGSDKKHNADLGNSQSDPPRGTKEAPFIVDTTGHVQTPEEAAKDRADEDHKAFVDRWTVGSAIAVAVFTGVLMIIGFFGVLAAVRTLRAIEKQAALLETQIQDARKSSDDNARDVKASIAEAVRSASAMEGVAGSMAINADSVKESVRISRDIADTQKLATTLQSRAYLSAFFNTAKFQDENHVFEVGAGFRNHGNTPAYNVTFRAVAQILPAPVPTDFDFPLPDTSVGPSVSFMAPGATKTFARNIGARVPDGSVDKIMREGGSQVLAMWGIVNYRDAFNQERRVRFAFTIRWIFWVPGHDRDKDGNLLLPTVMSYDMAGHNDAD